jgi:hypothetical protein
MNSALPTLRGSLSQLHRSVARYYAELQQRFEGNCLIREMWASMSRDQQAQLESLKKLPPSFWMALKDQEKDLVRTAEQLSPAGTDHQGIPLQTCLVQIIDLEEPIILKICAPLTRRLRSAWTELALDFYVMVKAHIARVAQSVQLFSGDPSLGQRCALLLQSFEKEVQEPPEIPAIRVKRPKKKPADARRTTAKTNRRHKPVARKREPLRSRVKIAKRAKPLVPKIKIRTRRTR